MDGSELLEDEVHLPRGNDLPMNPKRLTKAYLSRLAEELGLPTKASVADAWQITEGKLVEMGKEPHNVHIELDAREEGEFILLREMDGVFLEVPPHGQEPSRSASRSDSSEEELEGGAETANGVEALRAALAEAQRLNKTLENDSKTLQEDLKKEKERAREMWRMNCAQLAGFDEALSSKEAEIEVLKERVTQLELLVDPGTVPTTVTSPVVSGGDQTHEAHRR